MAQFSLYVDTVSGELVTGPSNSAPAQLPKFYQGDTPAFYIYLLDRTTTYPMSMPYTIRNNSLLSLKVALGPKDGTAGSTLYTQQFTWAKSIDNTAFYGTLPLNTAAVTSLIGSASSASAWLEIETTEGGLPTTVFQKQVTIEAEVIESGSLTTPPGATAMAAEEANAVFLKRTIYGQVTFINETTGKGFVLYADENGAPAMDVLP